MLITLIARDAVFVGYLWTERNFMISMLTRFNKIISKKFIYILIAAVIILFIFGYVKKPPPLASIIAQEIRSSQLIAFEPVSLTSQILSHYENEEKLFLDVLHLSQNSFFADSDECKCKILVLEFPVNALGYSFLSMQSARFIFSIKNNSISFRNAFITRQMI